jgi:hypothetical protein
MNRSKKNSNKIILSLAPYKTYDQIQAALNLIYQEDDIFFTINVRK